MTRIARRSLLVLSCIFICASLIAAAPMPRPRASHAPPAIASPAAPPQADAPPAAAAPRARLAVLWARSSFTVPAAPAPAEPAAPPPPARIPGYGPPMRGTLVAQTERIDVYVGTKTFSPEDIAALAWKLEALLRENEAGFYPTKLERRISLAFYRQGLSPSRGTRGIAYTADGRIEIFYGPDEDMSAAFTVAAHELAHHLQYARYGEDVQRRADRILLEGGATWICGVRWLRDSGVESWRARALQLRDSGVPLRLLGAERYGSDAAYDLWASFVSYLVKTYGEAAFDELYRSSSGRAIGSADYKGVLGKSLAELAEDWRAYVES